MTLDELREYIKEEHGNDGLRDLPARLERVEKTGTSARMHNSLADTLSCNRAGEGEKNITEDEIWERFANAPKKEKP